MRRIGEFVMYAALSVAQTPAAWLALRNVFYFRAHPEALEVRDSAGEALWWIAFEPLSRTAHVLGALLALYFLITGPRGARICVAVIAFAYAGVIFLTPPTSFTS